MTKKEFIAICKEVVPSAGFDEDFNYMGMAIACNQNVGAEFWGWKIAAYGKGKATWFTGTHWENLGEPEKHKGHVVTRVEDSKGCDNGWSKLYTSDPKVFKHYLNEIVNH